MPWSRCAISAKNVRPFPIYVRNRMNEMSVRRSYLGVVGGKTRGYFLTSEYSGYFRFISGYVSTMGIYGSWSSGSQTSLGISSCCRNCTSCSNSISGSTFVPRPPRARDRVTKTEDKSALCAVSQTVRVGSKSISRELNDLQVSSTVE